MTASNPLLCAVIVLSAGSGSLAEANAQRARNQRQGDLQVGMKAPDFTIKVLGSEQTFTLSTNFRQRPTVLIFGSYT